MKTYSTKEASEILGIKERAVQTRCKKERIRKKDNKYLITDDIIAQWKQTNAKRNANANNNQLDLELEVLKVDNANLKNLVKELEMKIVELKAELKQYDIAENEQLEVFTNEQYILFEQRLKEWQTQRLELEHQEQLFTAEKKSLNELYEHYKNQFEYQRNQNAKVLEMHQKLLDIISSQSKAMQERNLIEAVEKNIVDKDTWKPK